MSSTAYLLTGIPLTAAFQLLVRRRPIHEVWVRRGPPFARKRIDVRIALVLVAFPLYTLVVDLDHGREAFALYDLAAAAGAIPAAYAIRQMTHDTWRSFWLCLLIGGVVGVGTQGVVFVAREAVHPATVHGGHAIWVGVQYFFLYLPVTYLIEEVSFRGLIDSHVHEEGERHGAWTALLVSVLWGTWHAPMFRDRPLIIFAIVMIPLGLVLSHFWRRSGNLTVTATTHVFVDSLRNAINGLP
jgi:membrane protease YdiL (CAAX protease family)